MDKKSLHIISHELPYPPTRGNVMGIYYRIRALHAAGIEIILHTFYKHFMLADPLSAYCKVIYQYPRISNWKIQNLKQPFFVQSRRSEALVKVLAADDHPILFEGLHTTFHFEDNRLRGRRKYVRKTYIRLLA